MLKKIAYSLFLIFVSVFLAVIQFSYLSALPGPFRQLNLVLIFLIFILFFFGFRPTLWLTLLLGFWLDLMTFKFFGLYLLSLSLTVWAAQGILKNWLTNRSLYSFLLLAIIATLAQNLIVALLMMLVSSTAPGSIFSQKSFWLNSLYQTGWSFLLAGLLFSLVTVFLKKWQPVFLEKSRLP